MAAKIGFAPEAERDLAEAYAWYESQRIGLGEEFLACAEACVETIRRSPMLYPISHLEYRRGLVRRFPYAVFYKVVGDNAAIHAVFHTALDPKKWRERMI